jgi:drug/metabolite transporter (DMT)-like permease
MLAGGAGLTVLGVATGELGRLDPAAVSTTSLLAVLYLIVFGSLLAFSAYVWLLRVVPTSKVATYAYVNPVVALLLGWAMAGEELTARTLLAAAVILASVVLIVTYRER